MPPSSSRPPAAEGLADAAGAADGLGTAAAGADGDATAPSAAVGAAGFTALVLAGGAAGVCAQAMARAPVARATQRRRANCGMILAPRPDDSTAQPAVAPRPHLLAVCRGSPMLPSGVSLSSDE